MGKFHPHYLNLTIKSLLFIKYYITGYYSAGLYILVLLQHNYPSVLKFNF